MSNSRKNFLSLLMILILVVLSVFLIFIRDGVISFKEPSSESENKVVVENKTHKYNKQEIRAQEIEMCLVVDRIKRECYCDETAKQYEAVKKWWDPLCQDRLNECQMKLIDCETQLINKIRY